MNYFIFYNYFLIIVEISIFFYFRGIIQLNSLYIIGSASSTVRFGTTIFFKELIKDNI